MKTSIFYFPKTVLYSLFGFLSILITSCGSYQNSSYYDSDGIYGNTDHKKTEKIVQNNSSNHYKEYFNSLKDNQSTEISTNVDDYKTSNDTIQKLNQDYAEWGSNSRNNTINIYTNPWSVSLGFGWGFPSYYGWGGYDYGWNYPYYRWSYSSFGWGYPYYYGYYNYPYYNYSCSNYGNYYYNRNYSYNSGRRGSYYNSNYNNSRYSQNNTLPNRRVGDRTYNTNNNSSVISRRGESQNNNIRSYSTDGRSSRSDNTNIRTYTPSSSSNSSNNDNRRENTTYSRSYSPNYNNSSNSGSYGGGRSSGVGRR